MGTIPKIMGILNCTPDSFSDGGQYADKGALVARALQMIEEGADWIDVGGESTRPGATPVSASDEIKRVVPVICGIREQSLIPVSIDTTKSEVAIAAIEAGAACINDVSAFRQDSRMAEVAARLKVDVILMHSRGTPQTMGSLANYRSFIEEVKDELHQSVQSALKSGIARERILIDPGFGFAKNTAQNLELLQNLEAFKALGHRLVIGLSRKKFIGEVTGRQNPADRVTGSVAAALIAARKGADILRVHDVAKTRDALKVLAAADRE